MAKSINQVIVMGNLTRDPEFKETPNGNKVVSFSLALNRSYQDQHQQWQEATDYVDVVAWGKLAEQVQERLSKGQRALVTGRIQSRTWDDKTTGQKRNKLELLASDVTFVDQSQSEPRNYNGDDVVLEDIDDKPIDLSEIPF